MEENRKKYAKSSVNPPKFDPHKKISMSADAPPPAVDYDVTYDPKIGKYQSHLSLGYIHKYMDFIQF